MEFLLEYIKYGDHSQSHLTWPFTPPLSS